MFPVPGSCCRTVGNARDQVVTCVDKVTDLPYRSVSQPAVIVTDLLVDADFPHPSTLVSVTV